MRITLCLEFDGVDSNSERADEIVDQVTSACKDLQGRFSATSCWVDDAQDEDAGWYRIERYYGPDPNQGWELWVDELFDTREEALVRYWDGSDELEDSGDIATLELPEDIRIVRVSRT